jgi:hypothetical protein
MQIANLVDPDNLRVQAGLSPVKSSEIREISASNGVGIFVGILVQNGAQF